MSEYDYIVMREAVRRILADPADALAVRVCADLIDGHLDRVIRRLAFDPKPTDPARLRAPDAP